MPREPRWSVVIQIYDINGDEVTASSGIDVPDRRSAQRVAQTAWSAGKAKAAQIARSRHKDPRPGRWFRLTGD